MDNQSLQGSQAIRRHITTCSGHYISRFVNELKFRSSKVHNKLELESDQIERSTCTNLLNKTIKDCIERKFPDRLYNSLSKKDITTLVRRVAIRVV